MAQYKITLDSQTLHQLFLHSSKDSGMAQVLESLLNQVLQAQADEQVGAKPYERSDMRDDYRNGTYPRNLTTRVGTVTLRIPRLRNGKFSTDLFERYQRSEQALVLALMEMVVNGVSTRKVSKITEELCGTEFSKSTVSALCKKLDPLVSGWNNRSLKGKHYPFVIVDALIIKVRENGRVFPIAALIATGVNAQGHREIIGLMLGDSESESSWGEFFTWIKGRGLRGVELVVSDQHRGLVRAIGSHFQGVAWQRCQTHFMRNILAASPRQLRPEIHRQLRPIFDAPDKETARLLLQQTLKTYESTVPRAMECLERGFEDATTVLSLPEKYRRRLRTTNSLERLNEEIRRRERVIRIFPNRESAIRLIGAMLMEIDEKWSSGKRYLDMEEYNEWIQTQKKKKVPSAVTRIG